MAIKKIYTGQAWSRITKRYFKIEHVIYEAVKFTSNGFCIMRPNLMLRVDKLRHVDKKKSVRVLINFEDQRLMGEANLYIKDGDLYGDICMYHLDKVYELLTPMLAVKIFDFCDEIVEVPVEVLDAEIQTIGLCVEWHTPHDVESLINQVTETQHLKL